MGPLLDVGCILGGPLSDAEVDQFWTFVGRPSNHLLSTERPKVVPTWTTIGRSSIAPITTYSRQNAQKWSENGPLREPARSFRFGCIYYSIHPNRNDREKTSPPSGNDHSCAPPSSRILGGAGVCGLIYTFISRPRSLDSRGMIRGMMPPEKTPKKSCVESSSDHSSLERDTLFQRGMIGRRLQVGFLCHFLGAIIPRSFREPDCKPGRHLTHLTGVFHPLGGAAFPLPNGKSGRFGACQG